MTGSRQSRRRYLLAIGATASVTGCLRLSEEEQTEGTASNTTAENPFQDSTGESPSGDTQQDADSSPDVAVQWQFEADGTPTTALAVSSGTVYVATSDSSIYGLDGADGSRQWGFQSRSVQTRTAVQPSPAVIDDTVYVGSGDGTVYALDASDGSQQWRFKTIDSASTPAAGNNTVYIASADRLYALSP